MKTSAVCLSMMPVIYVSFCYFLDWWVYQEYTNTCVSMKLGGMMRHICGEDQDEGVDPGIVAHFL